MGNTVRSDEEEKELSRRYEPGCRLQSSPRSPQRVEETLRFVVQESTGGEVVRSMTEKDESVAGIVACVQWTPTTTVNDGVVRTRIPRMA